VNGPQQGGARVLVFFYYSSIEYFSILNYHERATRRTPCLATVLQPVDQGAVVCLQ